MDSNSITASSTISPSVESSENPKQFQCNHCRTVLRSLAVVLLILLFLFALTISIAWLLLHPQLPILKAESLSASGFNISDSGFSAKYDLQITITNPNKKINMWIDHFSLQMVYNNVVVSIVELPEPCEGIMIPRNMHSLKVNFTNELNQNKRKRIVRDMSGDWSKGVISFDMIMNIWVKYRCGSILPSKQKLVKVSCEELNIVFSPSSPSDVGYLQVGRYCLVS